MKIIAENIERVTKSLTDDIGVRLAGSAQEYQAAEYLAAEFRKYSDNVTIEEFPVGERNVISEKLEVEINGKWQEFPCSIFGASVTTDNKVLEGELVIFDTASSYQKQDLSFITGKAVIHLGCHIENEDFYRRLMEAKPSFILFVDTRYPGKIPLADGLFPSYAKKYGSVPSLNVAYMDAWNWLKNKAVRAKVCVNGSIRQSKTTAVICEIKGTLDNAKVIYAAGHHDTQAGTVGADDNAIGCASIVELARVLAQKPHKHTFKLISFGAEEQLSLGSSSYVRKHRAEIEKDGVFMCNFDSFGSVMGWYEFTINGNSSLLNLIREIYNRNNIYYVETTLPCPYTDQFPFAACKVPGIWHFKKNCTSGLFYHHRVDNTPEIIDFDTVSQCVESSLEILEFLANCDDIDKYREIPADQQNAIDELFNTVYGGF